MTESIGSTTTVNNDAHVRVWVAQIPAAGTYHVTTDGQVNGYIAPRLAFGHSSSYGYLVWVFVALFVVGLADSILSGWWLARTRRRAAAAVVSRSWGNRPSRCRARTNPPTRASGWSDSKRWRPCEIPEPSPKRNFRPRSGGSWAGTELRHGIREPKIRDEAGAEPRPGARSSRSSVTAGDPLLVVDDLVTDHGAVAVTGVHDGLGGQLAQPLGDRVQDRREIRV